MHVQRDQRGDFTFDPAALADRFQLSTDDFRRNIRRGLVTSMVERGEGEDVGHVPLAREDRETGCGPQS
jgi:hypothetical protein